MWSLINHGICVFLQWISTGETDRYWPVASFNHLKKDFDAVLRKCGSPNPFIMYVFCITMYYHVPPVYQCIIKASRTSWSLDVVFRQKLWRKKIRCKNSSLLDAMITGSSFPPAEAASLSFGGHDMSPFGQTWRIPSPYLFASQVTGQSLDSLDGSKFIFRLD